MQTIDIPARAQASPVPGADLRSAEAVPRHRGAGWLVNIGLAAVLLALLLIPRWQDLDALVTPDEPLWVARSANFYEALSSGDFDNTYQAAHPGVVTMWLGTFAFWLSDPDLPERMGGQIETSEVRARVVPAGELPIDTLTELRKALVVANSLVVVALFFSLIPLVGRWPAVLASALLGLDPVHIGFTRLLHQDGLSTNLLLLAVVAYCWRLQTGSRTGLVISGIATGLALLTRSVNGVLGPLLMLLTVVDILASRERTAPIGSRARSHAGTLFAWGCIAAVTTFALWPALWVAPIDTIDQVTRGGSDLASAPHQRQVLFRGEVTAGDPGWIFYPVVMLYRISPATLIGLALAAVVFLLRSSTAGLLNRRLIWSLSCFAVAYMVILSLAAKKLDRYLLPSLAALDLVAALGAVAFACLLGNWVFGHGKVAMIAVPVVGGAILLAGQAIAATGSAPYYLTYVSPLMGGVDDARDEISLGSGEGGKAVAEALRDHPEMDATNTVGSLWPRTIDYYLPYQIGQPVYGAEPEGAAWFLDSQYVILTEPEIQRQFYPPSMIAWFGTQEPVVTVWDDGRVYARVFDFADAPLPEPYYVPEAPVITWGEARLVTATFRTEIEPGMDLRVRLFFETTGEPFSYSIRAKVVDEEGNEVGVISKRLRVEEPVGPEARSIFDIDLPPDLPLGTYTVHVSIRDRESGDQLTGVHAVTREATDRSIPIGTFSVVQDVTEPEA